MPSSSGGLLAQLSHEGMTVRRLLLWPPLLLLLGVLLAGMLAAYQRAHIYSIDVGTPRDQAYVRNFHARLLDGDHPYRWSDVYGFVSLPGLGGSRAYTISLELDPTRVAPVTVIVDGEVFLTQTLSPGWQVITLRVDGQHPRALASRDTVIELRAPETRTEDAPGEPKGVKVGRVRVEQAPTGEPVIPPYSRLAYLLAAVVAIYLFTGRAAGGFAPMRRSRILGLVAGGLFGVAIVTWMTDDPVAVSASAAHWLVTGASMLVLLVVGEAVAGRIARVAGWRDVAVPGRLVGLCLALGFGLRYAGMALPQSVIIDMPWHMKWLETLLAGNWQALYFPTEEGLSSVPREWGINILIPKSPLFYFAMAPLSVLPFELVTLVKWLICFLDSVLVMAVYWLGLHVTRSWRAAIWGAALFAVMPLAFRAVAYGILPTIFAQWLAAIFLISIVATGGRRWGVAGWAGMLVLLTLALLAFPTVAIFLTLVLLAVALAWWLDRPGVADRTDMRATVGGAFAFGRVILLLSGAWALAIVAYYGLYISPVMTSAQALLARGKGGDGATVRWPGGFSDLLGWTAQYVVSVLPALLALAGLGMLFARLPGDTFRRRIVWLLVAWLAIAPMFLLINYRVDMIGKHLFFTMAPVAVAGGIALWHLSRRGRVAPLFASLLLATIAWQGLVFWIDRLVRAST